MISIRKCLSQHPSTVPWYFSRRIWSTPVPALMGCRNDACRVSVEWLHGRNGTLETTTATWNKHFAQLIYLQFKIARKWTALFLLKQQEIRMQCSCRLSSVLPVYFLHRLHNDYTVQPLTKKPFFFHSDNRCSCAIKAVAYNYFLTEFLAVSSVFFCLQWIYFKTTYRKMRRNQN